MRKILYACFFVNLLMLAGCSGMLTKEDVARINTIGVVNEFPDLAEYNYIGPTIISNEKGVISDPSIKNIVTKELIEILNSKGFNAKEITSIKSQGDTVDLVVKIDPNGVYGIIDAFAYGVSQHESMFGLLYVKTYASLNIIPNYKGDDKCFSGCFGQSISQLPLQPLPRDWGALDKSQKETIVSTITKDINKSLVMALEWSGLSGFAEEDKPYDSDL